MRIFERLPDIFGTDYSVVCFASERRVIDDTSLVQSCMGPVFCLVRGGTMRCIARCDDVTSNHEVDELAQTESLLTLICSRMKLHVSDVFLVCNREELLNDMSLYSLLFRERRMISIWSPASDPASFL
jgi:hypothetical protein